MMLLMRGRAQEIMYMMEERGQEGRKKKKKKIFESNFKSSVFAAH